MANSTAKFGFKPCGASDQKGFGGTRAYYIPATESNPVGIGDVVIKTVGTNAAPIYGIPAGVLPTCSVRASDITTATAVTGVVVGIAPIDPFATMADQGKGGVARVVFVMEDLDAEFIVCAESGQTVKVGGNCGIDYIAPVNGVSQVTLKGSTTTSGLPFRVVGVVADPWAAEDTKYVVRINSSTEANATAGLN